MSRDINWCHENQNGMKKIVKISSVHALINFELSKIASAVASVFATYNIESLLEIKGKTSVNRKLSCSYSPRTHSIIITEKRSNTISRRLFVYI